MNFPDQIDCREIAKQTLLLEAKALESAAFRIDERFDRVCALLMECSGKVVCSGLGKSGHVARKIAATLASTGTPAFFLHPSEALHGDLGMIGSKDCLLTVAFGGETAEVLEVCRYAKRQNIPIVSITGQLDSSLAQIADHLLDGSVQTEACPLNLAPTCSSTLALALGDALAVSIMRRRGFAETDFAHYHPGGSLGRRFLKVEDLMRPSGEFQQLSQDASFKEVIDRISAPNFGIVAIVGSSGELIGSVSDGDIRRGLLKFGEKAQSKTAEHFMGHEPKTIFSDELAVNAAKKMESAKITNLFVLERNLQGPVGLLRMHDLLDRKII